MCMTETLCLVMQNHVKQWQEPLKHDNYYTLVMHFWNGMTMTLIERFPVRVGKVRLKRKYASSRGKGFQEMLPCKKYSSREMRKSNSFVVSKD